MLSKINMSTKLGENMDAGNTFAVLTAFAFLATLPVALAIEGPTIEAEWAKAMTSGVYSAQELILRIVASGLTFYLYNEVGAADVPRARALLTRRLP